MSASEEVAKFERYAETHPESGPIPDFERNFFRQYLADFKGMILDIGTGDGKYAKYFNEQCPTATVVPCDLSMTRILRTNQAGFRGIVSIAERMPFRDKTFDRIFLIQVIEHIESYEAVFEECRRLLKDDGYFLVTTPNYPIKRLYDWMVMIRFQKWKKFYDDPTHCTKFSAGKLKNALQRKFSRVELYPTFLFGEGRLSIVREWREKRRSGSVFFSHKLLAVCRP